MKRLLLSARIGTLFLAAAGCSAPAKRAAGPPQTPTPGIHMRTNPNVIEETEVYFIERLPKKDYIRVDDRRIRHPIIPFPVEFFKEDEEYYYVYNRKTLPEEIDPALQAEARRRTPTRAPSSGTPTPEPPEIAPTEFADLTPQREPRRLRLEEVADSGLPREGLWRASFVVADMNGDRIPDIVAPPPRLSGDAKPRVFLGDGKGKFTRWPLQFAEDDKEATDFSIDYGGIAVGDINGDGKNDIAAASHSAGLVSLLGDGKGGFAVVRKGLPMRDFSSQAVALVDADSDGKLDIVGSRDMPEAVPGEPYDKNQVRLYLNRGKSWEFRPNTFVGAAYSNSLHAWDYDSDGKKDVVTGSHYFGALTFVWKNEGDGSFSQVAFPEIEYHTYHFATVPATFGAEKALAFAGAYYKFINQPEVRKAAGINIYRFKGGAWSKHPVWRQKDGTTLLYALATGDLDGDGFDDVVFPDSERMRLRVFFQRSGGTFTELEEKNEPVLDSPGQCMRVADVNGDGRLDVILSKTVTSGRPEDPGGWNVYLNRR